MGESERSVSAVLDGNQRILSPPGSCAEWLAWRTGRTVATCRENVRVAHALEDLPKTSAEMKAGQLSYAKARAITRVATPETEGKLLDWAATGRAVEAVPAADR